MPSESSSSGSNNNAINYRDTWKKRQEEKNTMVFNFVGVAKEVGHIENDGRDISRRATNGKAKKKRNRSLAKVG